MLARPALPRGIWKLSIVIFSSSRDPIDDAASINLEEIVFNFVVEEETVDET